MVMADARNDVRAAEEVGATKACGDRMASIMVSLMYSELAGRGASSSPSRHHARRVR
eukprot:CAMPEP_0185429688 /NCGR_PEP_ID=MMETSP1365-20130426/16930_1 /TAXON_ID=38817 /ORGANISM="Gephyrocapsa oceanica, Strain RCC1303" /LENGTH=56 /DNA_ID=CAMNT_0028033927 /DNA_START=39 /DNA_END=206 /DNA_ORIENTATION=-